MAETLADLLREKGIQLKHHRPGSAHRINCPACPDKDFAFSIKIDADGQGFTGNCKHASCGHRDGGKVHEERVQTYKPREEYKRPAPVPIEECEPSMACYSWFRQRGINADTVDLFGVYDKTHRFRVGENFESHEAIVFPYKWGPAVVNHKYRGFERKGLMGQDPKPQPTLFNINAINELDPDEIVWVEGECDVMAIHQAGYPQVVSLKDGAPDKLKDLIDPEDKRFFALDTHREMLSRVKKVYLAGDMDGPGQILQEELARRLGRHKCWLVTWPEGCKDANDVLRQYGEVAIQDCISRAEAYPIDGVIQPSPDQFVAYKHIPPPPVMLTGIDAVDQILKIPGEGRVIIVTGIPNSGKTNWVLNTMVHLMKRYNRKFAVFSPEAGPWMEFLVTVSQMLTGRPYYPRYGFAEMDDDEARAAAQWFVGKLFWLGSEEFPSMAWILETTQFLVLRYGVTDCIVDPFNEVEPERGQLTDTEYVGRCLQMARKFGERHGVNVWIVAHPAKMAKEKDGKIPPPGPYDIAGSAHWANKSDLGITIHTPGKDEPTELQLWKSRHRRWGRKGNTAKMAYDEPTGRYENLPVPGSQSAYKP